MNYVLLQVEEKRCFSCMQSAEAFLPLIFELMMCILTSIAALQFGVRRGYEMISFEVFALMEFVGFFFSCPFSTVNNIET